MNTFSFSVFHTALENVMRVERKRLATIQKELDVLPNGTLSVNRKGSKTYFVESANSVRRGVSRDLDLVYQLARKQFLLLQQQFLRKDVSSISRFMKQSDSEESKAMRLLKTYQQAGLDIARITLSPEDYRWMHSSYRSNPFRPEERRYVTSSGIRVRSKSERTIANRLELNGIPYRYEAEMELDISSIDNLNGTRHGQYKTYYPDFLIRRMNGSLVVWEHLGLLHLESYRASSFEKLFMYRQVGGVAEADMIFTVESDLVDINVLDEIIMRRILLSF